MGSLDLLGRKETVAPQACQEVLGKRGNKEWKDSQVREVWMDFQGNQAFRAPWGSPESMGCLV